MAHELDFPDVKPLKNDLLLSHFKAEEKPPGLHKLTIPEALVRNATENAENELFIFRAPGQPRRTINGQQLMDLSQSVAVRLIEAGIKKTDRVGLLSPNCPEYIFADYGIIRAGAAVVRMHSSFKSGEDLVYIIKKTECKGIIVIPGPDNQYLDLLNSMLPNVRKMDANVRLELESVPSLEFIMISSDSTYPGLRNIDLQPPNGVKALTPNQAALVEARQKEIQPEDPCSFYLTSGSTGFPKVVALNHLHLVNQAFSSNRVLETGDLLMTDRPFSHIGGNTLLTAVRGIRGVCLDPKTAVSKGNTDFFFTVIEEERVSCSLFFPYILHDLMDVLENKRFDLSSIKKGIVGGQCIPRHIIKKCMEKLPDIYNGYGTTEAGPVLAMTIGSDQIDLKLDYTGYPMPHTEFKVVDDEGNIVPVNTTGMLYVRTPLMFVCYWKEEEKTKAAKDEDGWYKTDDMAVMNERGYLNVLGRKTEVIMKASINIYPVVVEKFLIGHPKIDKVGLAKG
jgi:fatty-acyl-CoA synthase